MNTSNAASSFAESVRVYRIQEWSDSGIDENLTQLNICSVGRVAHGL
jgi:hypothetical protein